MSRPDQPDDAIHGSWGDDDLRSRLAAAGRALPMPEVPEAVTNALTDLFQDSVKVQWTEAQLIRDSRSDDSLVGARGPASSAVWTATYCAPKADIVLDGVFEHDGTLTASGQIFPLDEGSTAFRVDIEGPTPVSAYTDNLGQFELGPLKPGHYVLKANNDRDGLILTFDGRPTSPEPRTS